MRPTHIRIIGKAKLAYFDARGLLIKQRRFPDLIAELAPLPHARITLSPRITAAGDVQPLLDFLTRHGIPENAIVMEYPPAAGLQRLQEALSGGLTSVGLSFGADVAEKDHGLVRYFVTTDSFKAIRSHQRHIVVGPKGSGKTAILRALAAEHPQSLVITPEHYATEVLDAILKHQHTPELAAFITTWKYTLLIEIYRRLVENRAGDRLALDKIREYLVASGHLTSGLTLFERFVRYIQRIKEVKGSVAGTGVAVSTSTDDLGKVFSLDEVLRLIPLVKTIVRRHPFYIYVDELDQAWDNGPTANTFLVALLTAAIQINAFDENLHVVVFIRSEIFDLLKRHLAQLDKLRSDIEGLRWDPNQLVALLSLRVLDSLRLEERNLRPLDVVRELFEGQMTSVAIDPVAFLLSRTTLRPREVIQIATLALTSARNRDQWRIDEEALLRAEEEFSKWKLEHIQSEYLHVYPDLGTVLEYFRGKSRLVSRPALDDILIRILLESSERTGTPEWLRTLNEPEELLKLLYQLEILGAERVTRKDASESRDKPWLNFDFSYTRPEAKIEESQHVLFHPALWKSLDLQ